MTARSIVTLAEVLQYMNLNQGQTTPTGQSWDDILEAWIDSISGEVESFIHNKVQVSEVTEHIDGDGSGYIYPTYYPVQSVTSLEWRDGNGSTYTDVATDATAFFVHPERRACIYLLDGSAFPVGVGNIKAVYTAGYEDTSAEFAEIKNIVLEMISWMKDESKSGDSRLGLLSVSSNSMGVSDTKSYADMKRKWQDRLSKYKKL